MDDREVLQRAISHISWYPNFSECSCAVCTCILFMCFVRILMCYSAHHVSFSTNTYCPKFLIDDENIFYPYVGVLHSQ